MEVVGASAREAICRNDNRRIELQSGLATSDGVWRLSRDDGDCRVVGAEVE